MLRHYELILMVHPNLSEEEASAIADKVTSLITKNKGEVIRLERWGKKKVAYSIRKCTKAYYFLVNFLASSLILGELERILRYDENVLRFQTVRLGMEEVESVRRRGQQSRRVEENSASLGQEAPFEG